METKKQAISTIKKILVSILVATVITGLLLIVTSYLIQESVLGEAQVGWVLMIIHIIASFVAGIMIGKIQRERKYMWGMVAGICWFAIILILSAFIQSEGIDTKELGRVFAISLLGGLFGGMLA